VFRGCEPTRAEFLYSATNPSHRDELAEELDALCPLAAVPKNAWRWVDTAQYKLTQRGRHRSAGPIDLLVCATAVHHGHTVLHVDNDFATVAGVLKEVQQRDIRG
jgi:predicted nucleic acid-binding protein